MDSSKVIEWRQYMQPKSMSKMTACDVTVHCKSRDSTGVFVCVCKSM